jgi:type I restriction enzyme, S subunit
MIDGLKPYPAMKDSGVPWLGDVPEHWEVRRIKMLFREKDERSGDGNGVLLSLTRAKGIIPQAEASSRIASAEDLSKYKVCRPGDLVMNRMQAWSGMFALSTYAGVVSPDYSVFGAIDGYEVKFYEHLLKTPVFVDQFAQRSKGIGSGFNRLYTPDFGEVPAVVPPVPEQAAIVGFLDYADRRIRHYIRARQKLIKLLEEQKQAIIHRFVTRGVDTNVKLKPSGLEWLGDVPEHWSLVPLKWIARIIDGDRGPQYPKAGDLIDQGIPFLSSKTIKYGSLDFSYSNFITMETFTRLRAGKLQKNDLVITVRGTIGNSALFDGVEYETGFINAQMMILRPLAVLPRYLLALTQSYLFKELLAFRSYGSAQQQLTNQILASLPLPLPPVGEQNDLLAAISDSTITADRAIKRAGTEIDLLREYRTRLICDVVTGKLDVREAAARLPVEVSKAEPLDEMDDLTQDEETAEDAELEAEETV